MIEAASAGIQGAMESNSERANRLGHLQFRALVAGGVLYVAWHVIAIACQERDLVDHAGRGDELVGGIPVEVEPCGLKADGEVQWPDMET
jgi:hypothetical protein